MKLVNTSLQKLATHKKIWVIVIAILAFSTFWHVLTIEKHKKDLIAATESYKSTAEKDFNLTYQNINDMIKQVYQKANTKVASMQDKDKITEIVEQRNKEVSKLRITSLWKSYCLDEPQEQECAGVV